MIVIGADVHKRKHTFVAVDEVGRRLGEKTVQATTEGHIAAIMWAREQFGTVLKWGIEDCRNMSARLERDLMGADQKVVRVPTKLMAQTRRSARRRGKSDPIDAESVARAVLREPDLPVASHDETSRELKLLTDRRDVLVAQRTSAINRLRWHVHELDPERGPAPRALKAVKHQKALQEWLQTAPGLVAEIARAELADVIRLTTEINALEKRLSERADDVAPIPAWSGATEGQMRLSRSGNRQLNAAIHRIAVTQIRMQGSQGHAYYQRLIAAGKTKAAARRCLKRRIARRVYRALVANHQTRNQALQPTAA